MTCSWTWCSISFLPMSCQHGSGAMCLAGDMAHVDDRLRLCLIGAAVAWPPQNEHNGPRPTEREGASAGSGKAEQVRPQLMGPSTTVAHPLERPSPSISQLPAS